MKTLRNTLSFVLAICVMTSAANAQSVVDLAKRERQRQQNAQSKTVLNSDSPRGTAASTAATAKAVEDRAVSHNPPPAIKPPMAAGFTDMKGRDEKWWRATFEKARLDVKRAEDKMKVLQLKENDLVSLIRRDSVATRASDEQAELDKVQKEVALAKQELADAQQKLTDLDEELRRAGGLPGWAR